MTDPTTNPTTDEPPAFDAEEVGKLIRERRQGRRDAVTEARERLAALEAMDADQTSRARAAYDALAERRQAEQDYREAEAKRIAEMPAEEIARRIRNH